MMQRPINNFSHIRFVLTLLCATVFVIPGVASARQIPQTAQTNPVSPWRQHQNQQAAVANTNFCSSIDTLSAKIMRDITQSETRYATKETEKLNTLADSLAKRDATRLEARSTWDSSHDEIFANLKARASTPEESQAVTQFQSDIDAAVAVRRKSIDDALTAFRAGVDTTLRDRKSGVEDAIKIFRSTTDIALIDAKNDCASGTPASSVRASYVADLNSGKQVFLDAVQTAQKTDDAMKKIVTDRDARIEAANTTFKKSLNQAQKTLQKSFPDA